MWKISGNSQESTSNGSFCKTSNFIKRRLQHKYFLVNFAKSLSSPFLQSTSGWLHPIHTTFPMLLMSLFEMLLLVSVYVSFLFSIITSSKIFSYHLRLHLVFSLYLRRHDHKKASQYKQVDLRILLTNICFSLKLAQCFFHHFFMTMLYFKISQDAALVQMTLLKWMSFLYYNLRVYSVFYCAKKIYLQLNPPALIKILSLTKISTF